MKLPRADILAKLHDGYVLEWHRGMLSTGWFWLRKADEDPLDVPLPVGRALVKRQLVSVLQTSSTCIHYTYRPLGTKKLPRRLKLMVIRMLQGNEYYFLCGLKGNAHWVPGLFYLESLRDARRLNDAGFAVTVDRFDLDIKHLKRVNIVDLDIFTQRAKDLGFL